MRKVNKKPPARCKGSVIQQYVGRKENKANQNCLGEAYPGIWERDLEDAEPETTGRYQEFTHSRTSRIREALPTEGVHMPELPFHWASWHKTPGNTQLPAQRQFPQEPRPAVEEPRQ